MLARWVGLAAPLLLVAVFPGCANQPLRPPAASTPAAPAAASGVPAEGITFEAARAGGPPAPANLSAASQTGSVHLSWMPGSSAAREFRVYRVAGADPAGFKVAGVVRAAAAQPVTFDDAAVLRGTTYTYFVTALDESGQQSGSSNMISITPR